MCKGYRWLLVYSVTLLQLWITDVAGLTCDKISDCQCKMSDGSGIVDLKKLDKKNPTDPSLPTFSQIMSSSGYYTYSYNPCSPFSQGQCLNVAMCETLGVGGGTNLGNQPVSDWKVDGSNNLHVVYAGSSGIAASDVMLVCDKTYSPGGSKFQVLDEFANPPSFQVTGSEICAAPSGGDGGTAGLSVGSILVITLFVILTVYFIGGISFLHFHKKADGTDKIPNKDFWSAIPGLVCDGNKFVFGRFCNKRGSYGQV